MADETQLTHDELVRLECLRQAQLQYNVDQKSADELVEDATKFETFVNGGTNG